MSHVDPSLAGAALRWRYATKSFDPQRRIPDPLWQVLLDSLVLAPSSFGLQPWRFLVIDDPLLRDSLQALSWNQSQVTEAHRLVVLAARTDIEAGEIDRWVDYLSTAQETPREALNGLHQVLSGFVDGMPPKSRHQWALRQVYIALGQLMTTAAMIGVDTCPLEGIDPAGYDDVLGLEGSGFATAVACVLGYRDSNDKYATRPKVRYPADELIEVR